MRKLILCFLLLSINFTAHSQSRDITGRLVGGDSTAVQYATIVLQTIDSTFVTGVVSDSLGVFSLRTELERYRLVIEHISHNARSVEGSESNLGVIELELNSESMEVVSVVGERPLVRVRSDGTLSYDMEQITKNRVVSNLYDAVLELPGVREQDGVITLAGASSVTVIINGKPSTMSYDQLVHMLKQMPISNVESADVMYSAPPQYHTRGAVINLVVRSVDTEQQEPSLQGEVRGAYNQKHNANYSTGASMLYKTNKLSADLLYSFAENRSRMGMDIISQHDINGTIHDIEQYTDGTNSSQTHIGRLGVDYKPNDKSVLSFVYNTSILANGDIGENSIGNFSESDRLRVTSNQFHNLSLDYISGRGLKVGAEYTYYNAPSTIYFSNIDAQGDHSGFTSRTLQRINSYTLYADQEHSLKNKWKLTYGARFNYASDYDYQLYDDVDGDISLSETDNTIEEYISVVYAGISKSFSERLSMGVSLTGEHYELGGDQEWTLFPQSQITYSHSPSNIFQFSLSSDKVYPSYWERQEYQAYINGYAWGYGNPKLKPYNNYSTQLTYIKSHKYTFTLYYNYQPEFSSQLAYQDPNELALIYKTENWDYNQTVGLSVMTPFRVGDWLDSRLTLNGYHQRAKYDGYYDIGFDNSKFIGYAALNNTINISSKPNIKLDISAFYMSDMIQGIYDMSNLWALNTGVKWLSSSKKVELNLKVADIFNSSKIDISVRDRGQNFNMFITPDSRSASLSVSYKFGGYKRVDRKQVDKSRLKR